MSKINEAIDRGTNFIHMVRGFPDRTKEEIYIFSTIWNMLNAMREPEDGLSDEFKKKFEEYSKSAVELTELQKAYDDGYNSGKLDAMKEPE